MKKNKNHNDHSNYSIDSQIYKNLYTCAGLNCSNKSITNLKVKYLNKTGDFCKRCAANLLDLGLAEKIPSESR